MWKKLFGVSIVGGIGVSSLYKNDWNVNRLGVVRLGRVAVTTGLIAYDYKKLIKNKKLNDDLDAWSNVHTRSASKLLHMCTRNGGVYIKVGQHIATLRYLIPNEYCDVLQVLHSKAPVSSIGDVKQILKEDLKRPLEELFSEFDEKPLGTASLAQVHRAKLRATGDEVAIKIQHKDVKNNSAIDIITMDFFFNLVDRTFPDFSMKWLAEETRINLPMELDFLNEGKNCERIRDMFKKFSWFKTPMIYWDLSTHRVLTMELMDGEEITNVDYIKREKINPNLVTDRLSKVFSEMIFVNGYVHCDPHPGNILVKATSKGPELILLDHGLYTVSSLFIWIIHVNFNFRLLLSSLYRHYLMNSGTTIRTFGYV